VRGGEVRSFSAGVKTSCTRQIKHLTPVAVFCMADPPTFRTIKLTFVRRTISFCRKRRLHGRTRITRVYAQYTHVYIRSDVLPPSMRRLSRFYGTIPSAGIGKRLAEARKSVFETRPKCLVNSWRVLFPTIYIIHPNTHTHIYIFINTITRTIAVSLILF